jgi:uncharacterized surface protein with fasciclin (FAS1) repeats
VILNILPTFFSTLTLGLERSGLAPLLNYTEHPHSGGTLFAPTNKAFALLGPKVNAFLFSPFGKRFLKALLEYHIVPDKTLYSTAFYNGSAASNATELFDFMSQVAELDALETEEEPHGIMSMFKSLLGKTDEKHHHEEDKEVDDAEPSFWGKIFGKDLKKPHWPHWPHPNFTHPHPNFTHPHPPFKHPNMTHPHPNCSHPHPHKPHAKFFKLPTLLSNHSLPIAVIKFGPFVRLKVNQFATVVVKDGLAKDGVIQVVNRVLIPPRPKKPSGLNEENDWDVFAQEDEEYGPEGMSLEDFIDRMAPYVTEDEVDNADKQIPAVQEDLKLEF